MKYRVTKVLHHHFEKSAEKKELFVEYSVFEITFFALYMYMYIV